MGSEAYNILLSVVNWSFLEDHLLRGGEEEEG